MANVTVIFVAIASRKNGGVKLVPLVNQGEDWLAETCISHITLRTIEETTNKTQYKRSCQVMKEMLTEYSKICQKWYSHHHDCRVARIAIDNRTTPEL